MGRTSPYKPEFIETARKLTQQFGATDVEVAQFFGISKSTLNEWKHRHPEFYAALLTGKEAADERVKQSLYQRALGYSHDAEEVFVHRGQVIRVPVTKFYPPDTVACIFWLKNRDQGNWRDKPEENNAPQEQALLTTAQRLRALVREIDDVTDVPANSAAK